VEPARSAARRRRARCCPASTHAATADAVRCCSAALGGQLRAVMSSKVNAASSLRPLAGPPHAPATCAVCSACAFVAPTATREQAASWQEAKHNNALPAWAFQNSGSVPKSACHVKVSCCNCAARLRVPVLAWRRTLWRRCVITSFASAPATLPACSTACALRMQRRSHQRCREGSTLRCPVPRMVRV
jgi:hypothetical protein